MGLILQEITYDIRSSARPSGKGRSSIRKRSRAVCLAARHVDEWDGGRVCKARIGHQKPTEAQLRNLCDVILHGIRDDLYIEAILSIER